MSVWVRGMEMCGVGSEDARENQKLARRERWSSGVDVELSRVVAYPPATAYVIIYRDQSLAMMMVGPAPALPVPTTTSGSLSRPSKSLNCVPAPLRRHVHQSPAGHVCSLALRKLHNGGD